MRFIERRERQRDSHSLSPLLHSSFDCEEGSIPFTRSNSSPFILNGLQIKRSCKDSDSHNAFNEPLLRSDVPTLCSDLCASVPIDGFAVAASV